MQGIVFVPGISGSELIYQNQMPPIWPPKWTDLFVYRELDELLDPDDVTVGDVIDSVVGLIPFYETTENDLRAISSSVNGVANGPYLPAPYDWRVDLLTAVDDFARKIESFANSVEEITIVSHSMGGLLTRLLLESKYSTSNPPPAWFGKITRALFVCTPHLGAPTALAKILGLEVTEVVIQPDQMKQFAGDSNFPAVYQLMPTADRGVLFDTTANKFIRYNDPAVVAAFGLSTSNLNSANTYNTALKQSQRPSTVQYLFVYGTGHQTDEYVKVAGLSLDGATPSQNDLGDGTVPIWSITEAAARYTPNIQTQSFPGSHVGILATDPFRQFLYSYFGASGHTPLVEDGPGVKVSLNKRTYRPGETMHILLIPDQETSSLSGSLTLSRYPSEGLAAVPLGSQQEIQFRGGPARSLPSRLIAPNTPGIYRLDFGGANATHKTSDKVAGWFAVSAPS